MDGTGSFVRHRMTAALFGLWVLYFWQLLVVAFEVPRVLLPAPTLIVQSLIDNLRHARRRLHADRLKAVLVGWVLGSRPGLSVARGHRPPAVPAARPAADRVPDQHRSAGGVAPIAVMWFGFEWPSKAAVVVLMTFFPMLVSTLAGCRPRAAGARADAQLCRQLQAHLWSLRLPIGLPFMFGALKVNATLALIGAIVAEFFGSPTVGLGFRISTEAPA
jgi:NitT/TauT family transport system permease protein